MFFLDTTCVWFDCTHVSYDLTGEHVKQIFSLFLGTYDNNKSTIITNSVIFTFKTLNGAIIFFKINLSNVKEEGHPCD